jgi:hypothetical protein
MAKIWMILLLLAVVLAAGGCASESGNREFVPGRGWVPT